MWGQRVILLFAATNVFDHPDTPPSLTLLLFASVAFRGRLLLPIEAYQLEAFDVSFLPTHDGGIHTGLRGLSFLLPPSAEYFPPSAEYFFACK